MQNPGNGNGRGILPSTEPQEPVYGGTFEDNQPNPIYDETDPVFSYKSGDFNLEYEKFIPFIGVYLIYRWMCKW